MSGSEAELIERIGAELARSDAAGDYRDDCGLTGETALVSTDALVEGVHFAADTDPRRVGRQAAVANLSDLAGSGGRAGWLVWALSLPPRWDADRVGALARGFGEVAGAHGARVVGGNLSRIDGPAVIAVTVGGPLAGPRPLLRTDAAPGHALYVTGPLGDAALGYLEPDAETEAARHAWRPHLAEAAALASWGRCGAAMDISDGLLLDAARLGAASGVGVAIETAELPLSDLYRARRGADLGPALSGGEDYVLLFSAPADAPPPCPAWRVGACVAERGLWVDGEARAPAGFEHFPGPAR